MPSDSNLKLTNKNFKAMMKNKDDKDADVKSENSSEFSDEDDEMVKILELIVNNEECMLLCHESMIEGRKLDLVNVLKNFAPVIQGFRSGCSSNCCPSSSNDTTSN